MGYLLDEESMIKKYCEYKWVDYSTLQSTLFYPTYSSSQGPHFPISSTQYYTTKEIPTDCIRNPHKVGVKDSCSFLFYQTGMDDTIVGVIILFISLFILCGALILIVKILNSMLKGNSNIWL